MSECCHNHEKQKENWVKPNKKLILSLSILTILYLISFFPLLSDLHSSFISYFKMMWWAILLGFVIGGILDHFVPDQFVQKVLASEQKRSLLYSVLVGFVMSACSHGILAIAMQLYKKGARTSSVITFLLASPWANLPVTILLFGFFSWKALIFIFGAMLIALVTGLVYFILEQNKVIACQQSPAQAQNIKWDNIKNFQIKAALKGSINGGISLANMVFWWIAIGIGIAILIKAYVPSEWVLDWITPGISGLLITLAVATVIEVCSEGSAPIAFEIFRQVGTLGNPFVFLMAGVVTDYTEIGLIWTNIGKKEALLLPIITVPQVLALAWLFNYFF